MEKIASQARTFQKPRSRELADCFNCSASRRRCDRQPYRCNTCSASVETCSGYPREWQWLSGVKSRGRDKGRTMSISASNSKWHSTTPINRNFVFKPGVSSRKRTNKNVGTEVNLLHVEGIEYASSPLQMSRQSPRSTVDSAAALSLPLAQHQSPLPKVTSSEAVYSEDVTQGISDDALRPLMPLDNWPDFKMSTPVDSLGYPSPIIQQAAPVVEELELLPNGMSLGVPTSTMPLHARLSASLLSSATISCLIALYETELCALPMIGDYDANPLRVLSSGSEHTLSAVIALCIRYLSRLRGHSEDFSTSDQVTTYRSRAHEAFAVNFAATTTQQKLHIMETTVTILNLDSLTSSMGPWDERLKAAYQRMEAMGGLAALSQSPRLHGLLSMLVWWDSNLSLLTRTEPVFPIEHHEFVVAQDIATTSNVFALSGAPMEIIKHIRELASLAGEKEQISKMRYAKFDTTRVLELERYIQDFVPRPNEQEDTQSEEEVHAWHDYYYGANAWKYGLLLYITRVLKWDRCTDPPISVIASLSRKTIDSVRCCRPTFMMQKQLLLPVFLAGGELTDPHARKFVIEYFEGWYQWCKYGMFKEAPELLQEIWLQKDCKKGSMQADWIWWGSVIEQRSPGTHQLLLS